MNLESLTQIATSVNAQLETEEFDETELESLPEINPDEVKFGKGPPSAMGLNNGMWEATIALPDEPPDMWGHPALLMAWVSDRGPLTDAVRAKLLRRLRVRLAQRK